jgi:hypothetical protein
VIDVFRHELQRRDFRRQIQRIKNGQIFPKLLLAKIVAEAKSP